MDRAEIERTIAPVVAIYQGGLLRGAAFFDDPVSHDDVTFGTRDLSEAEVALAVYKIIMARGFNIERICIAVTMLARSQERRN